MNDWKLGAVESRFADIIWANQPVSSRQLVELAQAELNWKKSTTYTILKRLCERGLFINEGGTVRALLTRDEFYAAQSEKFVEESFSGSLPAFLAAFSSRKKLSTQEIEDLQKVIDRMKE